jgi:hypothetical protein
MRKTGHPSSTAPQPITPDIPLEYLEVEAERPKE